MKNLVILTGAGISAESGIQTFRDQNGLWEGHNIMQVASQKGFKENPAIVLDFYNKRRRQLLEVTPNSAHYNLVKLEEFYNVQIITQNVDDLHERAGSKHILHLHGELLKVRSTHNVNEIYNWNKDLYLGDVCKKGFQLRPHIVWFGENVPLIEEAIECIKKAAIFVIIGTSLQVYPAANIIEYLDKEAPVYYIDPLPSPINKQRQVKVLQQKATEGTKTLVKILQQV